VPKLRIAAISFLNTAPLMWDFVHGSSAHELAKSFDILYTVPSKCAEMLSNGEADIGIIPAITYQTIPDLFILPDIAIATRGPVRSILYLSNKPLDEVKTVAADTSSRTSVALLKILFAKWWRTKGKQPEFVSVDPDAKKMLKKCDAALLIGDPALVLDRTKYKTVIDLGEEWTMRTKLPFVFAFWAVRKAAVLEHPLKPQLAEIFKHSRSQGLENVDMIALDWAPKLGLSQEDVVRYLTREIDYNLEQENLKGLYTFWKYAGEIGVLKNIQRTSWISG
jgi:chorismate dehydratase